MKYLLTQSQYNLLVESIYTRLKRRLNYDVLKSFVTKAELDYPTLCDDFGDEFEYADNVISRVADDFLMEDESFYDSLGEDYDDTHDFVHDYLKDLFGEYLLEIYRMTCSDY